MPEAPPAQPTPAPGQPQQSPAPVETLTLAPTDLQFKSVRILSQELSLGLGIPASELCFELETESCLGSVHKVALLGVEAFLSDAYSAFKETQDATAAALDRVALSACAERARRDIAGSDDGIFSALAVVNGRIENLSAPSTQASIEALYLNLLRRKPSQTESAELSDLYGEIVSNGSAAPAQDWATLSCFTVATSSEFIFY
jgi:hypothetical protein